MPIYFNFSDFAIDENERIVGVIDFRHELKGFLKDFGNSGYSVRPSERKKGYATQMLSLILERAKETGLTSFQLSAEKSNTPSIKTIIKNGGVFYQNDYEERKLSESWSIKLKCNYYKIEL